LVLFVWDELLVDFGCACGGGEVEVFDERLDCGVFGELHGLGVDGDLHVKLYVPNPRKFGRLLAGGKEAAMRVMAAAVLALGLVLGGCDRPRESYSRSSPEAVVESAVLMVQKEEAERLTELVYARDVGMRSLLNQIGLMLGAMEELSDEIAAKFPEELEALRASIEADGGKSLVEQFASASRRNDSGGGDRFREIAMRIFSDPYGWIKLHGDKLDVIYIADDTYGVMYDGKVLLEPWGLLVQEQEDGWYLMLPTNLPGASRILPNTDDEYAIWGSLFKTVENGVRDMAGDVRDGRTTSMNQLGQSAVEKFAIPAVMVAYAYAKYKDAEEADAKAAKAAGGDDDGGG
jgi:hypothetical protein